MMSQGVHKSPLYVASQSEVVWSVCVVLCVMCVIVYIATFSQSFISYNISVTATHQ